MQTEVRLVGLWNNTSTSKLVQSALCISLLFFYPPTLFSLRFPFLKGKKKVVQNHKIVSHINLQALGPIFTKFKMNVTPNKATQML